MNENRELGIKLSQVCNTDTINIFSDGSTTSTEMKHSMSAYGCIAVIENEILRQECRLVSNSTNNNAEIKGVRMALDFCFMFIDKIKYINIFSDSQISIKGLKEYIYTWRMAREGTLYAPNTGTRRRIASQEVFVEARKMLDVLEASSTVIRLFHISAHVDNNFISLSEAATKFKELNEVPGKIDLNFIRYATSWNNYIDETTRSYLRRNRYNEGLFFDPLRFYPDGAKFNMEYNNIL